MWHFLPSLAGWLPQGPRIALIVCLTFLVAGSSFATAGPPSSTATPTAGWSPSAADGGDATPGLLAVNWNIGKYFSGMGGRARVVQVCVVVMCVALFIMMRKLR